MACLQRVITPGAVCPFCKETRMKNRMIARIVNILHLPLVLALLLLYAPSCQKDEPLNNPPVADFSVLEDLDEFFLFDESYDPDGDPLSLWWNVASDQILLSGHQQPEVYFRIPLLQEPLDVILTLVADDGLATHETRKTITLPVLNEERIFGLGMECTAQNSNEAGYEWYVDQANSGTFSNINCGPASAVMAAKWAIPGFTGTTRQARDMILPGGGWWYTNNIIDYLNHFSVTNFTLALGSMEVLRQQIDQGNIAILCLDMYYIRNQEKNRWHVDRFYNAGNTGWGHFIIVKGYKIVDGQLFFEAYDPYGFAQTYPDGAPKGKNRYYREAELNDSSNIWWDYAIIISRDPDKMGKGLDPVKIPHQAGR